MIAIIAFAAAAVTTSLAPRLSAGLAITLEQVPEPVAVDGVSITIQRATGKDVPALVRRIEESWQNEGSQVTRLAHGNWNITSRFKGASSEVLQWNTGNPLPELLLSVLDVRSAVRPAIPTGLQLPPGCAWSRSISGSSVNQSYLQRSARCLQSISTLSAQLQKSLPAQGWRVLAVTDSGIQIKRNGADGFLSFASVPGDSAIWLSWLRVEPGR